MIASAGTRQYADGDRAGTAAFALTRIPSNEQLFSKELAVVYAGIQVGDMVTNEETGEEGAGRQGRPFCRAKELLVPRKRRRNQDRKGEQSSRECGGTANGFPTKRWALPV